jgi:hypothetical protein
MALTLSEVTSRLEDLERRYETSQRELRRLQDIEEIRQVKYRYFRAIDSADSALLASVLTEDFNVKFRGDAFELIINGRADFVERMAFFASDQTAAQHQGHHPEIEIDADGKGASGIWYLQDIVHQLDAKMLMAGTCFYKDRYLRTAEGWKLQSSWWDRHLEVRHLTDFKPNYTGRYLKTHGRKRSKEYETGIKNRVEK